MKIMMSARAETWPIRGSFNISRGAKTEALVVVARLECEGFAGVGECLPYGRYNETSESVLSQIEEMRPLIESGAEHAEILAQMHPGAARNAVDCAYWDLESKRTGIRVHAKLGIPKPRPLAIAMTVSLDDPEEMAETARQHAWRPLLKVKLCGDADDARRIRAVSQAAPESGIILDANEGWRAENIDELLGEAASAGVLLVEQPLPAGEDGLLAEIPHPVPLCADESAHTSADLEGLAGKYECVNIKLDKTGGLTHALSMRYRAHQLGFSVMVGCMVASSLSMAPAVLLAQDAEYADLDGALLLARDRENGLVYSGSEVSPPVPELWG
jgi:L-Ala-D/L-Glu epimerase / N-acetyl-D-glutamate racemase